MCLDAYCTGLFYRRAKPKLTSGIGYMLKLAVISLQGDVYYVTRVRIILIWYRTCLTSTIWGSNSDFSNIKPNMCMAYFVVPTKVDEESVPV